jgi:hypothetical protein
VRSSDSLGFSANLLEHKAAPLSLCSYGHRNRWFERKSLNSFLARKQGVRQWYPTRGKVYQCAAPAILWNSARAAGEIDKGNGHCELLHPLCIGPFVCLFTIRGWWRLRDCLSELKGHTREIYWLPVKLPFRCACTVSSYVTSVHPIQDWRNVLLYIAFLLLLGMFRNYTIAINLHSIRF